MEKLLLIDGNSIMNRAFYGVPDLTVESGLHTNAVYGFLNILFKFLDEEKPDYLAIAFDMHAPTFRHKMFEGYKGTRKGMPEELKEQVPYIHKMVSLLNIPALELEGYEADDILGTLAKRGQAQGLLVTLVSGDRDLLQISDTNIKVRVPKTVHGKTTVEDYFPDDVYAKYGVTPKEFIDLKALMGDSSDNIPGVPKVGEKTATELIKEYHSLDSIYDNLDKISKPAIKNSLSENKDLAYLCLKLATIEINSPVTVSFEDLKLNITYTDEGYKLVKELSLKSFYSLFENNLSDNKSSDIDVDFEKVEDFLSFSLLKERLLKSNICSFGKSDCGYSFVTETENLYITDMFDVNSLLNDFLKDYKGTFVCLDSSLIYPILENSYFAQSTTELTANLFFVDLAAYLVNPTRNDYSLESLLNDYLHISVNKESVEASLVNFVYSTKELYLFLVNSLSESAQLDLYKNVEMPLSVVLFEMQKTGILVDNSGLLSFGENLDVFIDKLTKEIFNEAGHEFNILSPKQLGAVLFEEMKLPYSKKTKTGYSTSADVLDKLAGEYDFVRKILEYRTYTKLKSTYVEGLSKAVGEDNRIHSQFLQTVTATGRISSAEPNLQNIPIRTELGRELRKVFIPKENCKFIDADYSQIELRILAHLSKDPVLTDAFLTGKDIHTVTASSVFHVPEEEITPLQRRTAKVVNFGIIYGISSFSLGQDLNIGKKEADKYIKEYFEIYPKIKEYLDSCVENAEQSGYSVTAFSRRRPIIELKSSQFMQREFGKRVAMNAPIQGTAADIMKIAMIKVRDTLLEKGCKSKILLQVHDELLLEVNNDEIDLVSEILADGMEKAVSLTVPLTVEVMSGDNWYEAK